MKIKVEKKSKNPLEDILDTLLNLDEVNFKSATRTIVWDIDSGLSFYYDDEKIDIPLSVIFDYLSESIPNYEEKSVQRERLEELLESRNEEKFFDIIVEESPGINAYEGLFVEKSFEILKDDELLDKFKNFDVNKETFLLNEKRRSICCFEKPKSIR